MAREARVVEHATDRAGERREQLRPGRVEDEPLAVLEQDPRAERGDAAGVAPLVAGEERQQHERHAVVQRPERGAVAAVADDDRRVGEDVVLGHPRLQVGVGRQRAEGGRVGVAPECQQHADGQRRERVEHAAKQPGEEGQRAGDRAEGEVDERVLRVRPPVRQGRRRGRRGRAEAQGAAVVQAGRDRADQWPAVLAGRREPVARAQLADGGGGEPRHPRLGGGEAERDARGGHAVDRRRDGAGELVALVDEDVGARPARRCRASRRAPRPRRCGRSPRRSRTRRRRSGAARAAGA